MSGNRNRNRTNAIARRAQAPVFAALGDETRLMLLGKLASGERFSISQLTEGTALTRQAITKHLRVMERVRIVRCVRRGRESLFEFQPQAVAELREHLEQVSAQWEQALLRLKAFVEAPD